MALKIKLNKGEQKRAECGLMSFCNALGIDEQTGRELLQKYMNTVVLTNKRLSMDMDPVTIYQIKKMLSSGSFDWIHIQTLHLAAERHPDLCVVSYTDILDLSNNKFLEKTAAIVRDGKTASFIVLRNNHYISFRISEAETQIWDSMGNPAIYQNMVLEIVGGMRIFEWTCKCTFINKPHAKNCDTCRDSRKNATSYLAMPQGECKSNTTSQTTDIERAIQRSLIDNTTSQPSDLERATQQSLMYNTASQPTDLEKAIQQSLKSNTTSPANPYNFDPKWLKDQAAALKMWSKG